MNFNFNFGWGGALFAGLSSFSPSDLAGDLLQWLSGLVSPSGVDDISTNDVDAILVDSVGAAFDGAADVVAFGDVWQTQNPLITLKVVADTTDRSFLVSRRSAGTAAQVEWQMVIDSGGLLKFSTSDGTTLFNCATVSALTVGSVYEVQGWYDRGAETTNLRFRLAGTTPWTTPTPVASGTITFSGALQAHIGDAPFLATQEHDGMIFDVEISEYDATTPTPLHSYAMDNAGGIDIEDTVGSADGLVTVGAGGTATFWGRRQNASHRFAHNGGTVAVQISDGGFEMTSGVTTGTSKPLSMMFNPTLGDYQIFDSSSKIAEVVDAGGGQAQLYYNNLFVQNLDKDEWNLITINVDVGSTITFGDLSSSCDFVFAHATLAGNGGWEGKTFDEVAGVVYNTDGSGPISSTISALGKIQYAALDDLSGTVQTGLAIRSTGGRTHNGGIFKTQELSDVMLFNGTTSDIEIDSSASLFNFGANDFSIEMDIYFATQSPASFEFIVAKTSEAGAGTSWNLHQTSSGTLFFQTSSTGSDLSQSDISSSAYSLGWNHILIEKSGTTMTWTVDGVNSPSGGTAKATIFAGTTPVNFGSRFNNYPSDPNDKSGFFSGKLKSLRISGGGEVVKYDGDFLIGTTLTDLEGTDDATTANITTEKANRAGFGILANGFWKPAGAFEFDKVPYTKYLLHASYLYNVWIKFGGNCDVTDVVTTDTLDAAQHASMTTWKGGTSCGKAVLPFNALLDNTGTPILDNNGDYILYS